MRYVRGDRLSLKARAQVLAAYPYRWTVENKQRACAGLPITDRPTMPLVTDEEWLRSYAFRVNKNGELSRRGGYCIPAYMADEPNED